MGTGPEQAGRIHERVRESQRRLGALYERAEERIEEAEQRLDRSREHHPAESDPANGRSDPE